MNKTLTRLFTVALLMMVSMGARAEIKIDLGGKDNNGVYEGGTVTAKQSEAKDGKVTVTLTFTPDKNYSITRKDVLLAYTAPTNTSGNTRADNPTLGETFNPSGSDDVFAYPKSATYTVTVDANLGLSVQKVELKNSRDSGAKAGGDEEPEDLGYSGTYYIASKAIKQEGGGNGTYTYDGSDPTVNYYLCPTEGWYFYEAPNSYSETGNGQPFLTTYKCRDGEYDTSKAVWTVEKHPSKTDCYYIKQWSTGRYIVSNEQITGSKNANRVRIHLETVADADALDKLGDMALFEITEHTINSDKHLDIIPHAEAGRNGNSKYLVVNNGNFNNLKADASKPDFPSGAFGTGTGGIIGLYTTEENERWFFEEVVDRPTITINGSGQVEITAEAGTTIYCTTDGTKPTTTGTPYTTAFSIPAGATAIKAIAVNSDGVVSKVATLKLPAYTYNIVDTQGHIAIKYTVNQPAGLALSDNYTSIPEAIRSPYLKDEEITFYSTFTEGSRDNLSDHITNTPAGGGNIYVAYTTEHLTDIEKPLHLRGNRPFKMRVNGEYVFDNNGSFSHTTSDGAGDNSYLWKVSGGDPYAVYIQNIGNSEHYFNWNTSALPTLTLGASSRFIIFGGSMARPEGVPEGFNDQLELMAATGEDISSSNYYNVGRDSDVGLLASNAYPHGNDAIQVLLKAVQKNVTFHIIDMSGRIVVEQSGAFDDLAVPEQWRSPLVQTYHYYKLENFRVTNGVYTLRLNQTQIDDFLNAPADIYVTYDPSDEYDLDGSENRTTDGKKYLLKFAGGTSFQQEKGDGFEATAAPGIYPYINGEGGLFVYGQAKLDATAGAVGSTRTRWAWYLEGGDPYRLRISSLQTKTDGVDDTRHSYLRTYKPQGYDQVVTGVISNTPEIHDASDDAHAERHKPTDYMILNGTGTHFKLVTSDVVDDLDGNVANDVRHTVTSFENYWKTNPTAAKLIHAKDETFVVGSTPTDEQITAVLTTGSDAIGWHTYNVWANGSTWTSSSKVFGYGPHWFKTIGVGTESGGTFNGDFDLEEYDLDGALILLDQHGWEVMRKPITNLSTKKAAYATELRKYDSPMVKKYHFWTNFIKEDGYHKYKPIRGNATASKNAQHKGVGTSLADYPEVFSGGTLADIYVTYEVMATYRAGYTGAATEAGTSASKYLIKQGTNYAKTTDGSTITLEAETNVDLTAPSSIGDELLWYVKPNFNIDTEMGYRYNGQSNSYGEKTQTETESAYFSNTTEDAVYDKTNGQNGFDPYNLQIESAKTDYSGKLFTTNATGAELDDSGGLVSTYNEGGKTVTLQSYAQAFDVTANYYDSGTGYQIPHVTNSTFMAVSDANGNIRLMPRFDHHNVSTLFTALDDQQEPAPYGDESGTQTTLFVLPSTSSPTPSGEPITISSSDEITDMNGYYILSEDFDVTKVVGTKAKPFTGTIDGQLYTIDGLSRPLVAYADGATIKNVIVKTVSINAGNADGNAGAICCQATGATRIYNCGILPTTTERDNEGNITGFSGSYVSGSTNGNVGGLVGLLDGESRVINCFSYANISGGTMMGGIVGRNNQTSTMNSIKTIVVNCMFYGEISGGGPGSAYPVYGGNVIENSGNTAINNYNYYRGESTFDDSYTAVTNYNRSWPAEEQNLTRFEYYRNILNSNRKLCTWWVNGTNNTSPTDTDVQTVGIAKWVLDPSIAPYPILKKWGKYPSIINPDPEKVWNTVNNQWVQRSTAEPYQGKKLGELTIAVKTGSYPSTFDGLTEKTIEIKRVITDMDTLNCDYSYGKVQLPYYNEVFGSSSSTDHLTRYYGNYTSKVVTAWKITEVTDDGRTRNSFVKNWENGYNYADRNCTAKDIYDDNDGRAFAQGGYYYVPEGVKKIEIEAYWGQAFYLHGRDHALDHVSVTTYNAKNVNDNDRKNYGYGFTPAGTLPTNITYNDGTEKEIKIYDDFSTMMTEVKKNKSCTVYDQAVVLVGNYPLHAQNDIDMGNGGQGGFTIMSADFDMDNEPDFCLPLQWRNNVDRRPIMPIRFDFLPVPELGLVMRHNTYAYAIGVFVPQGHFEITETSFMHTTQFEYMSMKVNISHQQPLIFNGGEFEQIVTHGSNPGPNTLNYTRNIILGGHVWMKRFTPGSHTGQHSITRHCAISVMGGEFPEFYLTGHYWAGVTTSNAYDDSPHCYTNGGRFGIMAGAAMEAVKNNVVFEIDHSIIDEFYGGGINSNNPVAGNISVTINNSLVLDKYCGGPKIGSSGTVTTNAKGTVFNQYFGGGNGGTNLYREQIQDLTPNNMPGENDWNGTYGFNDFTPISNQGSTATYDAAKGYHAEFEFEVFNQSNGINNSAVARTYRHWAQFGTTTTGDVTNSLENCTLLHNFYGGGNLATVDGSVTSTLKGTTHVMGNAYGAGYSAAVPSFPVHDKTTVSYPYRDPAGVCHNGSVGYIGGDNPRKYTWCYKNPTTNEVIPKGVVIPEGVSTEKPAFQYEDEWFCYTTVTMENLGAVLMNATITLEDNVVVGTAGNPKTGNVFGGGDASAVKKKEGVADSGNTTVILQGNAEVLGNVFGGGNQGLVEGSATVNIRETPATP